MKKLLAACVVLALAVGWWLTRSHDAAPAARAPVASERTPAQPTTGNTPLVKKLAGSDERREVEQRIAAARAARAASAQHAGTTAPPQLPARPVGGIESLPANTLDALKAAIPYLEKCFGPDAPKNPIVLMTLEGDPDVGTLIDPGQMTDDKGAPLDPALTECLHSTLTSLQLPPLVEGSTVQLQYSFRL